jgi:hypothetical protein
LTIDKNSGHAVIEGDHIVIRVSIEALPTILGGIEALWGDDGDPDFRVSDAAVFARDLVYTLNDERHGAPPTITPRVIIGMRTSISGLHQSAWCYCVYVSTADTTTEEMTMTSYSVQVSDGNGDDTFEIETETQEQAETIAQQKANEWLETGDWDTSGGTLYLHARWSLMDADGKEVADGSASATIQPSEPKCTSREGHDWQSPHGIVGGIKENPGVWGHGGGVKITEVCLRCGCGRHTDTWAQDPTTGKQGLESVSYEAGEFADEIGGMR